MPELPEVENVVRELRPALIGRRLLGIECHFPGVLVVGEGIGDPGTFIGTVTGLRRRGKLVLIDLDGDRAMSVHLRMTGAITVADPDLPRLPHTHVTARIDDGREWRFTDPRRFGRVEVRRRADLDATPFLRSLGPEPFDLDPDGLARRLAGRHGPLKGVLLDQHLVAGLGNIYVDEILHRSGLHPRHEADRLLAREVEAVVESMHSVLGAAIDGGGSTIRDYRTPSGREGAFTELHRVFGRAGQPCGVCSTPIRKIRLAGRGTHFCPTCQPRRRRRKRRRVRNPK